MLAARRAADAKAAQASQQAFEEKMTAAGQQFRLETLGKQQAFEQQMTGQGQEFQREQTEAQFQNQYELMREQHALGEGDFEFRLTAQQKSDQERLGNALQEVEASPDFSEPEKAEARRRIIAQLGGIQPLPMRKEPSKYPAGQDVGQSWTSSEGLVLTRQADGSIKKIGESRTQPTYQDRMKAWELAIKAATKMDKNGEPEVDMAEARTLQAQILGTSRSALGPEDNYGLGPNPSKEEVLRKGVENMNNPPVPAPAPPPSTLPHPPVQGIIISKEVATEYVRLFKGDRKAAEAAARANGWVVPQTQAPAPEML
jgi:hypothetical protein